MTVRYLFTETYSGEVSLEGTGRVSFSGGPYVRTRRQEGVGIVRNLNSY